MIWRISPNQTAGRPMANEFSSLQVGHAPVAMMAIGGAWGAAVILDRDTASPATSAKRLCPPRKSRVPRLTETVKNGKQIRASQCR
jgi:hypothetical protein